MVSSALSASPVGGSGGDWGGADGVGWFFFWVLFGVVVWFGGGFVFVMVQLLWVIVCGGGWSFVMVDGG